jgi:hypothetical protein
MSSSGSDLRELGGVDGDVGGEEPAERATESAKISTAAPSESGAGVGFSPAASDDVWSLFVPNGVSSAGRALGFEAGASEAADAGFFSFDIRCLRALTIRDGQLRSVSTC